MLWQMVDGATEAVDVDHEQMAVLLLAQAKCF
jgi:hypothetical protein